MLLQTWKALCDPHNSKKPFPDAMFEKFFCFRTKGKKAVKESVKDAAKLFAEAKPIVEGMKKENPADKDAPLYTKLGVLFASFEHYYCRLYRRLEAQTEHNNAEGVAMNAPEAADSRANLTTIPPRRLRKGCTIAKCLLGLDRVLCDSPYYKPINLERFLAPLDNRTYFIAELKQGLSATFEYWRWACGSRSDVHTHVVWKVPLSPTERSSAKSAKLFNECTRRQSVYLSRAAASLFTAAMQKADLTSGAAAANAVYSFIAAATGSAQLPMERSEDGRRALLAAHLVMLSDCMDLAYDLRAYNGRPDSGAFEEFWNTLADMVEEYKKVDDRRHGAHALHAHVKSFCITCCITDIHICCRGG